MRDTAVLVGRSLRHVTRSLDTVITTCVMPIAFLLLFVYVFGGAIETGSGAYVDYLLPGILPITIATGISYTGFRLYGDMSSGIVERFQSMPIARSAVLWAHVLTSLMANLVSLVVVVLVALLMGFRSDAGVLAWLAVAGILVLFTLGLTWLAVVPGLTAQSPDGAVAFSYPLVFLPFISSAFVPTDTMPGPVRAFAEHQPVTSIVDTIRALLAQQPVGNGAWVALAWCAGLLLVAWALATAPTAVGSREVLTISQLAAHAGVTVRAVRHYHAKGLLPEPERDHSGYRRYDAAAVVELIRIRTLADAGVPLSRVRELLAAGPEAFAAAVVDLDRRLRAEVRELQEHRQRIARLAASDSLALPPAAVAYFDRMRKLGFSERFVKIERDSWIMIAAQLPDQIPALMDAKVRQVDDPVLVEFFRDLDAASAYGPDDPRLVAVADRVAAMVERAFAHAEAEGMTADDDAFSDELVALLDQAFLDSFPGARRLLALLEERGWTGWTMIERSC